MIWKMVKTVQGHRLCVFFLF
uniref:Uncharacterized protein n=1 Tax=Anguilla anguilla TaxID=7936 RepID=A0A0E9TTW5_ANGAN